ASPSFRTPARVEPAAAARMSVAKCGEILAATGRRSFPRGYDAVQFRHIFTSSDTDWRTYRPLAMRRPKSHSAESSTTVDAYVVAADHPRDAAASKGVALAPTSPSDEFGRWFATQSGRLPSDFELDF